MKHAMHLFIALVLATSIPALADFRTVTRAHEVSLGDARLPSSENGFLTFKSCASCEAERVSVTSDTAYVINDERVALDDFRSALALVRDRDAETLTVMQHLESNTITAVTIRTRTVTAD